MWYYYVLLFETLISSFQYRSLGDIFLPFSLFKREYVCNMHATEKIKQNMLQPNYCEFYIDTTPCIFPS